MSTKHFLVRIDPERCKGCELCVSVCPRKILKLHEGINSRGQNYACVTDQRQCIGCLQCTDICPDTAIEIDEETRPHA